MYAAYDALPQRLKDRLDGRKAAFVYGGRTARRVGLLNEEDRNKPETVSLRRNLGPFAPLVRGVGL